MLRQRRLRRRQMQQRQQQQQLLPPMLELITSLIKRSQRHLALTRGRCLTSALPFVHFIAGAERLRARVRPADRR